jgi:hypothetical protein
MSTETEVYNRDLKGITEAYSKSKSWEDVITSGYFNSDDATSMEAFIDFVEDIYKTKIKDAKQLDKLTELTTLLSREPNIKKGKEPTLEYILIKAKYSKYFRALERALQEGAKYKHLLQIKPQDFGLPQTWSGCLSSDQYSSILWALSFEFMMIDHNVMLLPDLRSIAQEIEAPYSVLMDCYKLWNEGSKKKEMSKDLKAQIDKKIKTRLPLLMEEIGDKYYIYFDKENYNTLKGKELKEFKEDVIEELKTEFCYTLSLLVLNELKENNKKEVDELRNIISQDIVKYFLQELVDYKNSVTK